MEMNAFAGLLAERNILGDAGTKEKLFAALEAEAPENMAEAMEIAAGLDRYTMLPEEVKTAEDYAVYYMKAEQMDIDIDADLQLFIDYKAYGEFRMRRDGVVQTEHGLVRREDIPMAQPWLFTSRTPHSSPFHISTVGFMLNTFRFSRRFSAPVCRRAAGIRWKAPATGRTSSGLPCPMSAPSQGKMPWRN